MAVSSELLRSFRTGLAKLDTVFPAVGFHRARPVFPREQDRCFKPHIPNVNYVQNRYAYVQNPPLKHCYFSERRYSPPHPVTNAGSIRPRDGEGGGVTPIKTCPLAPCSATRGAPQFSFLSLPQARKPPGYSPAAPLRGRERGTYTTARCFYS